MKIKTVVALLLAGCGLVPRAFATPPAGYYLAWSDEFNEASLDTTKWDYWLLGQRRDASNVVNAVSLNGSNLVITTYTSNAVNYTAMLASDTTFRSRYGCWETSIKWSDTNGMWSAFWFQSPTMGTYLYDPQVSGSEIDDAEHRYVDGSSNNIANQVQVNIHWNGYGSSAASTGSGNVGSNLGSGFHTYGFLWTPGGYSFSIDGSTVYSGGSAPVAHSTEWVILSSEVDDTSTTWAGYIPPGGYGGLATSAAKLTVDYVRYYAPTNMLFWTGANDATYLTNSANYVSNLPPLAASDLTLSLLSGNNLSPVLGGDLTVDGLVFLWMNNGASVNGANTLTLGAGGIDMVAANHTVNINCPVNVGANQTWSVGPNSPGNTLLVNGPISGSATLTKASYGTLILNGTNSFSGTLNLDTGITGASGQSLSDGITRITRSENVANVPAIAIRNNNGAWSTLQLTNSSGNLVIPATITLAGRNTNVVAIQNLSGSNTLSGNFIFSSGGANYWFDADGGTLNLSGLIPASAPTVPSARTLTFMGAGNILVSGIISNANGYAVSVFKTNSGALTLSGANSYTGTTTVAGGSLWVNGSVGAGSVTVNAGTLGGNGVIGGATTVQSGSTLAPGVSGIATLSFGGNLTLAAGSTNVMEINAAAQTNDQLSVSGTLNFGGILRVSNLAGTLTAGANFKLFTAANYAGNFAVSNLPALGTGLAWNTTNVAVNGTLSVIAMVPPSFSSITQLGDGNFQFNGTGAAYGTYELDAATNLAPPIGWAFITNAVADQNGRFQLSDMLATNFPQRFYRIMENL